MAWVRIPQIENKDFLLLVRRWYSLLLRETASCNRAIEVATLLEYKDSKSFLSIMALYLRCIFYPNSKLFIVSGGKEQSARIAQEKIEELWKFKKDLRASDDALAWS